MWSSAQCGSEDLAPGRGGGDGAGRRGLATSPPGTRLRDVSAVGGTSLLVGV